MKFNIICTEDGSQFEQYREIVKNRKNIFTIKQIFVDHWNNFLNAFPNLNIRDVVFKNIRYVVEFEG